MTPYLNNDRFPTTTFGNDKDKKTYSKNNRYWNAPRYHTLGDDDYFWLLLSFLARSVLFSSCPYCHSRKSGRPQGSGICCSSLASSWKVVGQDLLL